MKSEKQIIKTTIIGDKANKGDFVYSKEYSCNGFVLKKYPNGYYDIEVNKWIF